VKTELKVDRGQLLEQIKLLESTQSFQSLSHLQLAVADTDWAKNHLPKPVTQSVVGLRITKYDLLKEIATKPGKRGRQNGPISEEQKAAMKAGRGKKTVDKKWIGALKASLSSKYLPVVEKVESGSIKGAVKAYCLQCTNENKAEIKNCTIISCALWGIRPFK
jgi:hypothetical protein